MNIKLAVLKYSILILCRHKNVKCLDSPLYSCLSLGNNVSVTGDDDGIVKMWDYRKGDISIMTFKSFGEFVSLFLKIDEHYLIASIELYGNSMEWYQIGCW